jgi:hypothetical protein
VIALENSYLGPSISSCVDSGTCPRHPCRKVAGKFAGNLQHLVLLVVWAAVAPLAYHSTGCYLFMAPSVAAARHKAACWKVACFARLCGFGTCTLLHTGYEVLLCSACMSGLWHKRVPKQGCFIMQLLLLLLCCYAAPVLPCLFGIKTCSLTGGSSSTRSVCT